MIVQYQPTGTTRDTNRCRFFATGTEAVALPTFATYPAFGEAISNAGATPPGSLRAFGSQVGKGHLVWSSDGNAFEDSWEMDDITAAQTAVTNIMAAIVANDAAITIGTDGEVVTPS